MSPDPTGHAAAAPQPSELDQIRADIAATRAELGDTVDQLAAKLDVKAHASAKAAHVKGRAAQSAKQAWRSAPPQAHQAAIAAGDKLGPAARQLSARARPHRGQLMVAAVSIGLLTIIIRRRRSRGRS